MNFLFPDYFFNLPSSIRRRPGAQDSDRRRHRRRRLRRLRLPTVQKHLHQRPQDRLLIRSSEDIMLQGDNSGQFQPPVD